MAVSEEPPGSSQNGHASARLPVILLSGFLGAGKTTLLRHILKNTQGLRVAVIVNDMAELNIDASLLRNDSKLVQSEEKMAMLSNGCICCTLRADLVEQIGMLAAEGKYDYLVIESSGISEPMQIAETFEYSLDEQGGAVSPVQERKPEESQPPSGSTGFKQQQTQQPAVSAAEALRPLSSVARLDTCVTVVDASNMLDNLHSLRTLKEQEEARGGKLSEEDDRNVADLQLEQLEFADVILLNKCDIISEEQKQLLLGALAALNPGAHVLPTSNSRVNLRQVLNTGRFDLAKAQQAAGWLSALKGGHQLAPRHGISSYVYRARRPFHPRRLYDFLQKFWVLQEPDWSEAMAEEGIQLDSADEGTANSGNPEQAGARSVGQQHAQQATLPQTLPQSTPSKLPSSSKVPPSSTVSPSQDQAGPASACNSCGHAHTHDHTCSSSGRQRVQSDAQPAVEAARAAARQLSEAAEQMVRAADSLADAWAAGTAACSAGCCAAADGASSSTGCTAATGAASGSNTQHDQGSAQNGQPPQHEHNHHHHHHQHHINGAQRHLAGPQQWQERQQAAADVGAAAAAATSAGARASAASFEAMRVVVTASSMQAAPHTHAHAQPGSSTHGQARVPPSQGTHHSTGAPQHTANQPQQPQHQKGHPLPSASQSSQQQPLQQPQQPTQPDLPPSAVDPHNLRTSARTSTFGTVLRSKGFAWLAGRDAHCAEWSSAGGLIRIGTGGPWFCELPRDFWPTEPEKVAEVEADFMPGRPDIGDRRQELVFIGINMDIPAVCAALQSCLCTEAEAQMLRQQENSKSVDPFKPWPPLEALLGAGSENGSQAEDADQPGLQDVQEEEEESEAAEEPHEDEQGDDEGTVWYPGSVVHVTGGARQLQSLLDNLPMETMMVLSWHAPWAHACQPVQHLMSTAAARFPQFVFAHMDLSSTPDNEALAWSQMLTKPVAQREGALPALRNGAKWPCATLHRAPMLAPFQATFTGASALGDLQAALLDLEAREFPHSIAPPPPPPKPTPSRTPASSSSAAAAQPAATLPPPSFPPPMHIQKGATDLKRALAEAQEGDRLLVVAWVQDPSEQQQQQQSQSQSAQLLPQLHQALSNTGAGPGDVMLAVASIATSAANAGLAGALKVSPPLPCLHVYQAMKVVRCLKSSPSAPGSFSGQELAAKLQKAAAELLPHLSARQPSTQPTQPSSATSTGSATTTVGEPSSSSSKSLWDPPVGKLAKPGAVRSFPGKGRGIFWPRMPCLRCGCPWWQGEDWDAQCMRCGWDCEADGYDDNSNPLPQFAAKHKSIMDALKEGRTPDLRAKGKAG